MRSAEPEIQRLKAFCKQLTEAIDEFEHELRRCTDALERSGGRSSVFEKRIRKLRENRDLNIKELQQAQEKIQQLKNIADNDL